MDSNITSGCLAPFRRRRLEEIDNSFPEQVGPSDPFPGKHCLLDTRLLMGGVLYKKGRARVWLSVPALVALGGSPPVLASHTRRLIGTSPRWLIEARRRAAWPFYAREVSM